MFGFSASYFTGTGSLRDFVFYFGSAVMQSYAALIAIPFTIAVIHLQSRYGFVAVDFLFRYSLRVFIVFGGIILFVYFTMMVANIEMWWQNIVLKTLLLTILTTTALVPLPFIVDYIKSLFTLKPSDIIDFLLRNNRIYEELKLGKYDKLKQLLSKVFLLTGLSVSDPSLELELGGITKKISKLFYDLIIPYIRESIDSARDKDLIEKSLQIKNELIIPVLYRFNKYIVRYLKYSKIQKPLINPKDLFPLLDAINDLLRTSIVKGVVSIGREYCYFVDNLREIMTLYIEDGRVGSALSIFRQACIKLLESKDDILDLEGIQKIMLEHPQKYQKNRLLPFTYDFYIDYTATIPCMTFKLLLQKLTQDDVKQVSQDLEWFMQAIALSYPILLIGYTFNKDSCECSKNCIDTIVELILKQDEVSASWLLALLIAWMVEAYIIAENLLSNDDKNTILKRIQILSFKIQNTLKKQNINVYAKLYDTGELKLMFNDSSVPLSELIYGGKGVFSGIISKYSETEICKIIRDILGFEIEGCDLYGINDEK